VLSVTFLSVIAAHGDESSVRAAPVARNINTEYTLLQLQFLSYLLLQLLFFIFIFSYGTVTVN